MKKYLIYTIIFIFGLLLNLYAVAPRTIPMYWQKGIAVDPFNDSVRDCAVSNEGCLALINNTLPDTDTITLWDFRTGLRWNELAKNIMDPPYLKIGNIKSSGRGTFKLMVGDWSDDGYFFACNLSTSNSECLLVYMWPNKNVEPIIIYDQSPSDWTGRIGDCIDVTGKVSDNTVSILISGTDPGTCPVRLTTSNNGFLWNSVKLANPVPAIDIDQVGTTPPYDFWAKIRDNNIKMYNGINGSPKGSSPPYEIPGTASLGYYETGIAVDEANGLIYSIGNYPMATGDSFRKLKAWRISDGIKLAESEEEINILNMVVWGNLNFSSGVEIAPDGTIIAVAERSGVARFGSLSQMVFVGYPGETPNYNSLQEAISSYCPGGENAGGAPPLPMVIKINPNIILDESVTLDVNQTYPNLKGNIVGNIFIRSGVPNLPAILKVRNGYPSGGAGLHDGFRIVQFSNNVVLKDLIICPSQNADSVDNNLVVFSDSGVSMSQTNWLECYNVIFTDIKTNGEPMITEKAGALEPPPLSGSTTMALSDNLFYADFNYNFGSASIFFDNCVSYASKGSGIDYRSMQSEFEEVTFNNCLVSYAGIGGGSTQYPGFYLKNSNASVYYTITGNDAGGGPLSASAAIQNNCHGVFIDGPGLGIVKIKNLIVYNDFNDASMGIKGNEWKDLSIEKSIINVPFYCVSDGFEKNMLPFYPVWCRNTFHCNNPHIGAYAIFSEVSSEKLTCLDTIFSGKGTKLGGNFSSGGSIETINCNFVERGPYAINARSSGNFLFIEKNNIYTDPIYNDTTFRGAKTSTFMDVTNFAYYNKDSRGNPLSGGADFSGVPYTVSGRVYDAETMNVLPGIPVNLQGISIPQDHYMTITDSQGRFTFSNLGFNELFELIINHFEYDEVIIRTTVPNYINCFLTKLNPAPPTNVRAIGGANSILVKWNASTSKDTFGYIVIRYDRFDIGTQMNGYPIQTTSFEDVTAPPGESFRYAVKTVDNDSHFSPESQKSLPAQRGGIEIAIPSINCPINSEFIVPVIVKNMFGLTASLMELNISYNTNYISFVGLAPAYSTQGVVFNTIYCNEIPCSGTNLGQLIISNPSPSSPLLFGSGAIVNLKFRSKPGIPPNTTANLIFERIGESGYTPVKIYKPSDLINPVPINQMTNATLKFTSEQIFGDFNGNGIIDEADLTLAINYLIQLVPPPANLLEIGDLNSDGVFNALDISILKQLIAGKNGAPEKPKPEKPKGPTDYNLSLQTVDGETGSYINITLSIDNGLDLTGGSFVISYDQSDLFLESVSPLMALSGSTWAYNDQDGIIRISFILDSPLSAGAQDLFNLMFSVKNYASQGFSRVAITDFSLSFENGGDPESKGLLTKTDGGANIIVKANLPLEIIGEDLKAIRKKDKKSSAKPNARLDTVILIPLQDTNKYQYVKHQIEFPGYEEVLSGTDKIIVKIQKLSLAEKALLPSALNSCFAIFFSDTSFSDPINVRVEYKDSDLLTLNGDSATEDAMGVFMQNPSTSKYQLVSGTQQLDKDNNTVEADSVAPALKGSRAYFAGAAKTISTEVVGYWQLYE